MSDPVTNVEIEDVLSSIRRLVSDDDKSPMKPAHVADALVLTPADRVQEGSDASEDAVEDDAQPADEAPVDGEDAADVEAADADAAEPAELDQSDHAEPVSDEIVEAPAEDVAEDDAPSQMESTIAGLEAAFADRDDEWEAEEGEENPDAADVQFVALHRNEPKSFDHVETEDDVEEAELHETQVEAPADEASDDGRSAEPVIEAAEAEATLEDTPVPEPGEAQLEEYLEAANTDASEPAEVAEAEEVIEAEAQVSDDDSPRDQEVTAEATILETPEAEEALEAALSDEDFLDEETLRDMIRDVVREELQGVLGERITRNVRKLVRREIHRAMSTQELD